MDRTIDAASRLLQVLISTYGSSGTIAIGVGLLLLVVAWFWWQDRRAKKALESLRELLREKDVRIREKDDLLAELRLTVGRVESDLQVYQRALAANGGKLLARDTDRLIQIEEEFRRDQRKLAGRSHRPDLEKVPDAQRDIQIRNET